MSKKFPKALKLTYVLLNICQEISKISLYSTAKLRNAEILMSKTLEDFKALTEFYWFLWKKTLNLNLGTFVG